MELRKSGRWGMIGIMYAILLPLGAISTLAGLVLIGFGVPIKEFTLGNTLIIAGATIFSGGLIVTGLAVTVRQLTRIANALNQRPPARPGERAESAIAAPRMPVPRGRPPLPASAAAEPPGHPAAPSVALQADEAHPQSRPRPNIHGLAHGGAAPLQAEQEAAPAPPPGVLRPPSQAAMRSRSPEVTIEPRPAPYTNGGSSEAPSPSSAEDFRSPPPAERVNERSSRLNPFDTVWPARTKANKSPPAAQTSAPEETVSRTPPATADGNADVVSGLAHTNEARSISILKSGVIDGMAYTLYTDGSIEAQLPQGMMRFSSIEDLRVYLERSP